MSEATFQIGDAVQIIPETAGMDWRGEPPHYIVGIDWHPKYGVTYTTSDVWPPRCEGRYVQGLTDEWQDQHLRAIAPRAPAAPPGADLVDKLRTDLRAERLKPCRHTKAKADPDKATRPDLNAWQTAQSEWFDDTILEIVGEYAAWRDDQGAGKTSGILLPGCIPEEE